MTDHKPVYDERIKEHKGYGLIQLIHGNGKGKTTSAIGQAIRALGADKNVCWVAFDKGGSTHYSERKILDHLTNMDFYVTGRDRIDPVTNRFDFSVIEEDKKEAERGLNIVKNAVSDEKYDLVILDEINSTVDLGMLDLKNVLSVLQNKNKTTEIILTGRNPAKELIDLAHLVTEVKMVKHYFYSGVAAREGLDY